MILAVAVCILAGAAVAHASGHGGGVTEDQLWNYAWRVLNFVVVVAILWKLAGSKIKDLLVGRQQEIKENLDDLAVRQADAEKKLKQVEQSIANLSQEKQAILDEAEKQGVALKAAIIEKAEQDAAQIREQAKKTAANEAAGAVEAIRAEVADLVVRAAEKIVQEKLSDADHDKLVDEYLTKVVLN
nr:F0F1 ATP synthase subunit B [Salidesulfovibrio onnuriiensis]